MESVTKEKNNEKQMQDLEGWWVGGPWGRGWSVPEEEGVAGWEELPGEGRAGTVPTMLVTCSQLYANYFTAPPEQPGRPMVDCSPRKAWSDGLKSPSPAGASQGQSALTERGGSGLGRKKGLVARLG